MIGYLIYEGPNNEKWGPQSGSDYLWNKRVLKALIVIFVINTPDSTSTSSFNSWKKTFFFLWYLGRGDPRHENRQCHFPRNKVEKNDQERHLIRTWYKWINSKVARKMALPALLLLCVVKNICYDQTDDWLIYIPSNPNPNPNADTEPEPEPEPERSGSLHA